ncbi:biotin-dependent carboxyltransferase family protein [Sporosarcina sp. ACRSL]|uniref:5-oxoprolinase subunit C family protein n=1 Tax=Sporosarcina sp. ACRSL TaxID=2918215 RepID=UPI001EF6D39D|nr:biotin-dependent carboxyltransferase family protein [Sporosarcina sp. ACRSL]MCG7344148.1 biotin-dependent carboxyltransferase family protein [Sporosarcina sp. ACRSL]
MITILNSGVHSSVQDTGRWGFQQYGMVVSGAMDNNALKIGNLLVGNELNDAGIEITFGLTTIQFESDRLVAITGADASPLLNDKPAPLWRPFIVKAGDRLQFQGPKSGLRSYIVCAGGFDIPLVLNSKSTYEKGKFGGFNGRSLQKGDAIKLQPMNEMQRKLFEGLSKRKQHLEWSVNFEDFCRFKKKNTIHVIPTGQHDLFDKESIAYFETATFTVSNRSDRMGCHLESDKQLQLTNQKELLSEAVAFGTLQVPPSGKPMILLADRQTTGGYPKIGQVMSADFSVLAQMKPTDQIQFRYIEVEQAEQALLQQHKVFQQIKQAVAYRLKHI